MLCKPQLVGIIRKYFKEEDVNTDQKVIDKINSAKTLIEWWFNAYTQAFLTSGILRPI
jgi:hypothetical protein